MLQIRNLEKYLTVIGNRPIRNKAEAAEVLSDGPAALLQELYAIEFEIRKQEDLLDVSDEDKPFFRSY